MGSSSLLSQSILCRALIKRRMENSVWMTLCPFVYLCSLLGTACQSLNLFIFPFHALQNYNHEFGDRSYWEDVIISCYELWLCGLVNFNYQSVDCFGYFVVTGISSLHSIQRSKEESVLTSINLSTAVSFIFHLFNLPQLFVYLPLICKY